MMLRTISLSRRRYLAASLGAAALGVSSGRLTAALADPTGVTLRAATYKGQEQAVMEAAGVGPAPYRLKFSEFASGNLIIEAINAGALDIGMWSEIPLVFAAQSQADVRTVGIIKGDVNQQVVLVPKDSAIQSIADLRGKRVGYVRATTSQYFLLKMLWAEGLDFGDIDAISLGPSDGQAAFESGALDAWAIYGYSVNIAVANGARVLKTARGFLSGNYHVGVRPGVLQDAKLREAAADYLVRLQKGFAWREANKDEWARHLAPMIGVPLPIVTDALVNESQPYLMVRVDDAAVASAQQVEDAFVKERVFRSRIDVASYFDTSFADVLGGA